MSSGHLYDIVLLGATGYTGRLTAEYIQEHVDTSLKWAIAGRNSAKLSNLAGELKHLNPDRPLPEIEVVEQTKEALEPLARKAKIVLTTIGPYAKYGTPVVEACAAAGTHYIDVTGETPWVYDMMHKHGAAFKAKGKFMISQCGIDSVPSDTMVFLLVSFIRKTLQCGLGEVISSMQEVSGGVSGGTSASALGLLDTYSLSHLAKSVLPYALSPVQPAKALPGEDIFTKVFGVKNVPELGILTDSPQRVPNTSMVNCSWGLFDGGKWYGQNFRFSEYMRVSNSLVAVAVHGALSAFFIGLFIPPVRWLYKLLAPEPGEGPAKEGFTSHRLVYKAIAKADCEPQRTAVANFSYDGSFYYLTGILAVEAALTILKGEDKTPAKKMGGFVSPATLGDEYVDRLRKAGITLDVAMLD